MSFKIFVLCVALASTKAGHIHSALRYETPIIATASAALKYEIPPTSKVEALPPVVSTSYGYSTVPLKHEIVAPAVKLAAVPALKVESPIAVAAPAIHVQTPAITRVEHLAPAVASSYKTEVITPPKVHVTHTPAVARVEHLPAIAKIDHDIPAVRTEISALSSAHVDVARPELRFETPVAVAHPTVRFETPTIAHVEHLAPAITSYKSEIVSAPAVKFESSPLLKIAKVEHLTPEIRVSAPIARTEFISHPTLKFKSFDHLTF